MVKNMVNVARNMVNMAKNVEFGWAYNTLDLSISMETLESGSEIIIRDHHWELGCIIFGTFLSVGSTLKRDHYLGLLTPAPTYNLGPLKSGTGST